MSRFQFVADHSDAFEVKWLCAVVEVARSSLARDRGMKVRLYSSAQVDEYWIVNHVDNVVEVYRDAHEGTWRSKTTYQRGETITMLAFPDVTVAVSEVLPPEV